jgi:DNA-binding response OmpR family regulator
LPAISTGFEQDIDVPAAQRRLMGTETILVVEDGDNVRRFIAQTLNRHGYRVHEAATEAAALVYARDENRSVDLLLTDVVLTGVSGREIAKRLVANRPNLRVIYMSGYTDDAIVHHGVLEPGLAFLQKPFSAQQLLTKIREVLDLDAPPPW